MAETNATTIEYVEQCLADFATIRAIERRLKETSAFRSLAEIEDAELDICGPNRLIEAFLWWTGLSGELLPLEGDGFVIPEFRPQRDTLVALESEFLAALPRVRRHSGAFADCLEDVDHQALAELCGKYLAYRQFVCDCARQFLPDHICAALEKRA